MFKFFNIPFIFEDWQRSSEFLLITFGREKKDIKHTTIEYIDNNEDISINIFWSVLHSNFFIKTEKPRIQQIKFKMLELNSKSFKSR